MILVGNSQQGYFSSPLFLRPEKIEVDSLPLLVTKPGQVADLRAPVVKLAFFEACQYCFYKDKFSWPW